MKIKKNIAKAAVAAGLSIAMTLSGIAPATMAWADVSYGVGSILINKVDDNGNVTYDGYQIFKANVTDDAESSSGKSETNIAWANDNVKAAVEGVIKSADATYDGKTAQDAAKFIEGHIKDTNNTTRVDSSSFAYDLAKAVDGLTATTSVTPGTAVTNLGEGYWLFVTNTATTDGKTDTTGTAPIFAVVGGSTQVTVSEKTSVPTVTKQVKNDATGSQFGEVADSEAGQEIAYELTGTVADNIATYEAYSYKFTDTLSSALVVNEDSVKAYIDGKEVSTDSYMKKYENNELVILFANLKSAKDASGSTINVTGTSKVVVDYTAKLDSTKAVVFGGEGNDNTVKITYSNNPHSSGTGETTPDTVRDYTYQLVLHKVDRTTEVDLQGAKFTIKATGADDTASTGKYVQSDGSLGDTAYEFETDASGQINVKGLDAGTYTVTETEAPSGYAKVDSFTFTITPAYDGETLANLTNTVNSKETGSVIAGDSDGTTTDTILTGNGANAADTSTGTVKVTVGDVKQVGLPLTGQAGVTLTWIAGGTVLAIGLAHLIRSRKEQSQE